ncbi:MAG: pentapeptide repeat-containing protein [Parvibaculum sp.]|nr:pentapeptide repeat-containing protein [Parvibaculum sp.]
MARFMRAIHVFLDPTRHPPLDSHETEDGAKSMGLPQAFVELIFDLMDDIARIGNWFRKNPIAGLGVVFLIVFLGLFAQRWFAESAIFSAEFWERDPEGIRNLIWALATLFAGAAGLYGLLLAGRRTAALDRQAQIAHDHRVLSEQAQITERFTKAVEQLGHSEVAVRLGAIYALERIAKDSERDFVTIMETLAAFVRERAPCSTPLSLEDDEMEELQDDGMARLKIDIAAAISVLARSIPLNSPIRVGPITERVDLRNADLRGLDMPGALLAGFRFDGSDLSFAVLTDANLDEASLARARCIGINLGSVKANRAIFRGALLVGASLDGVKSKGASFANTNLRGATMSLAKFEESNFVRAKLRECDVVLVEFSGGDFGGATFVGSYLSGITFERCNFSESNFRGAILSRVVFGRSNLSDTNFGETRFEDWENQRDGTLRCSFGESDLSSADLSECLGLRPDHLDGAFYRVGKNHPLLPREIVDVRLHRLG